MKSAVRHILVALSSCFFPILFALLLDHPLAASFRTESGATLHAWASKSFLNAFPFLALALLAATVFVWQWTGRQLSQVAGPPARLLRATRPLLFLPLVTIGGYLSPWIGLTAAGLILPYGCALIAAWMLENLLGDSVATAGTGRNTRLFTWSILVYGIFIFAIGLHYAETIGQEAGDEAHYLIQLESLVTEGNLELSTEMQATIQEHGHAAGPFTHHRKRGGQAVQLPFLRPPAAGLALWLFRNSRPSTDSCHHRRACRCGLPHGVSGGGGTPPRRGSRDLDARLLVYLGHVQHAFPP